MEVELWVIGVESRDDFLQNGLAAVLIYIDLIACQPQKRFDFRNGAVVNGIELEGLVGLFIDPV